MISGVEFDQGEYGWGNDYISFLLTLGFLPVLFLLGVDLVLAGLCVRCVCVVRGLTTISFACFISIYSGVSFVCGP